MVKKTGSQHASSHMRAAAPFDFDAREIKLKKLLLDPNNYRFLDRKKFKRKAATRYHEKAVQRATFEALEQGYQLDELKQSILKNGYVPMERIIVVDYPTASGFYVVVEGNRRVAALKSILKDAKEGAIDLTKAQQEAFSQIPCAVLKSSGDSLKHAERVIMGIRHIAGPQEWGAYQQALLVSELKDQEEHEFNEIGEMLGISSVEAARRYRAVGALQAMEEDDLFSKKAEPAFYRLFHELVSIPEVRKRFGWSEEDNSFKDLEKAREFFGLICSDGKEDAKLQTYMDVRKLRGVIGKPKAEDSLFDPEQPFSEAIKVGEQGKKSVDARSLLKEARASLEEISIVHLGQLDGDGVRLIDDLIELLKQLKKAAESNLEE